MTVKLRRLQRMYCKRCGYAWTPRKRIVKTCAKCRSPYFNKPRMKGKGDPAIVRPASEVVDTEGEKRSGAGCKPGPTY